MERLQFYPTIHLLTSTLSRLLFARSELKLSHSSQNPLDQLKEFRSYVILFCRNHVDLIIASTCFHFLYHFFSGKNFYTIKAARSVVQSLATADRSQFALAALAGALLWGLKISTYEVLKKKYEDRTRFVFLFLAFLFCLCLWFFKFQHFVYLIPSLVLATASMGMMKAWELKVSQAGIHLLVMSFLNTVIPILLDLVWVRFGLKGSSEHQLFTPSASLVQDTSDSAGERTLEGFFLKHESRTSDFCRKYFSIFGIFNLHHSAVGFDFVLCPINSFLMIPLALVRKSADALSHIGWAWPKTQVVKYLGSLPTLFQFEIEKRIYSEVFKLDDYPFSEGQKALIKREVKAFISNRTSGADLVSSTVNVWIGVRWFGKAGLSPMEMGKILAKGYSHEKAVSKFFLGKTVGSWYYHAFPVAPSRQEIIAGAIIGVTAISAATLVSGFLFDLLQTFLGVNERNFKNMMQRVVAQLKVEGQ